MPVIILHQVPAQILEVAVWYQDQRDGLGVEFVDDVDAAISAIGSSPRLSQIVYRGTRRKQLQRFPYGVFYVIKGDDIYVFAVCHLHRNPREWKRSLPSSPRRRLP